MEPVEERAAQALARVPEWLWDGESLPVPIEDIADSVYGLLVRDVEDMTDAPGPQWLMVCAYGEHGDDLDGMCRAFRASGVVMQRRIDDLFVRGERPAPTDI
jgi:hypothetical protein